MAGVSIATVDRVLHKRGKVKPETRETIEKIIRELDYQPNIFARNLVLGPSINIAVLMPKMDQDGGYWRLPARGIDQASVNLKPFHVNVKKFEYDKFSERSFLEASNSIVDQGFDGLLIAPIQMQAAKDFVDKLPSGMPHIYFDSEIPDTKCLSTIHQKSFYGGGVAAKLFDMVAQTCSTIAIVRFLPTTYHIDERIRGFREYFKAGSHIHLLEVDIPAGSHSDQVHAICESVIKNIPDLKGLFVTGSHTYEVAECISDMQLKHKMFLIGFDLVPDNIRYMRNDFIDFLISQSPDLQGFTGIYLLYRKLLLKEDVDREITLPIEIITRENLDFYLNRRAIHSMTY